MKINKRNVHKINIQDHKKFVNMTTPFYKNKFITLIRMTSTTQYMKN